MTVGTSNATISATINKATMVFKMRHNIHYVVSSAM
jgi:hypothetical protein